MSPSRHADARASDLLFSGGREGYFFALDARNGELLWKANVGGAVASGPMTYAVTANSMWPFPRVIRCSSTP